MGLRVYANGDEYMPPIIHTGESITIEFDVDTPLAPDLQINFRHASKDWVPDENLFLDDKIHDHSVHLSFDPAPNGVHKYTFHYKNSFPDENGFVQFRYSGNYLFSIVQKGDENKELGEGRFIVSENLVNPSMTVDNKYLPEYSAPFNQMQYITVVMTIPTAPAANPDSSLIYTNVNPVDIIQNWKLYNAFRIDADHRTPDTFVDITYQPKKKFTIRDVPPANEYRRLDLSSASAYPNGQLVRLISGADLSRYEWPGTVDANGAAKLRPFTGSNSDYLDVLFRLQLPGPLDHSIFLVGAFNAWNVLPENEMQYDSAANEYSIEKMIRRGVYDYQYVTGTVDPGTNQVTDQDWLELEGNDWRTINRYTAIVYYHDQRFGGFDRVVGIVTAKSPGGTGETDASSGQTR
jgi:Type 9 secretion system plug protein 1st domain